MNIKPLCSPEEYAQSKAYQDEAELILQQVPEGKRREFMERQAAGSDKSASELAVDWLRRNRR